MRALVVHPGPHFSVADVHNGLVKGLKQNGVETVSFNLDERLNFYTQAHLDRGDGLEKALQYEDACRLAANGLLAECYKWWPDIVVVMSGFFLPAEFYVLMRERRHHVVLWCTESPYEDVRQCKQAPFADTVIVNDPTNLDDFRSRNPRTWYIPHSYDPDIHNTTGPKADPVDFSFVGTGYQSRIDFFEKVDWSGIHAKFYGNWQQIHDLSPIRHLIGSEPAQCMDNADTSCVYRASKVSANLYRKEAEDDDLVDGWAMGPREVELAACGSFFLREPRGEGDELLWMLPTFHDPGEFSDLLRWWIHPDRDEQRAHLARLAREAVAERTFKNHAAELLRLISG